MKAIKEIKKVKIHQRLKNDGEFMNYWYWWAVDGKQLGLERPLISNEFISETDCINHFKKFAKLNGIKGYKFV